MAGIYLAAGYVCSQNIWVVIAIQFFGGYGSNDNGTVLDPGVNNSTADSNCSGTSNGFDPNTICVCWGTNVKRL